LKLAGRGGHVEAVYVYDALTNLFSELNKLKINRF